MAWITEKPNGYMVRWRDAETGRTRSTTFQHPKPGTVAEVEGITALAQAESFARDVTAKERRSRTAINRLPFKGVPIFSDDSFVESDYAVANYLRKIIRQDSELTQSSRETYYHNIRNHIEGTVLGRTGSTL